MGLYALNLGLWLALLIQRRRRRLGELGDLTALKTSASAPGEGSRPTASSTP